MWEKEMSSVILRGEFWGATALPLQPLGPSKLNFRLTLVVFPKVQLENVHMETTVM